MNLGLGLWRRTSRVKSFMDAIRIYSRPTCVRFCWFLIWFWAIWRLYCIFSDLAEDVRTPFLTRRIFKVWLAFIQRILCFELIAKANSSWYTPHFPTNSSALLTTYCLGFSNTSKAPLERPMFLTPYLSSFHSADGGSMDPSLLRRMPLHMLGRFFGLGIALRGRWRSWRRQCIILLISHFRGSAS